MVEIDLSGRVSNVRLGVRNGLQPLFEAIMNSIHAIEDRGIAGGKIEVGVHRADASQSEIEGSESSAPITGFSVEDNGIGFIESNWRAFRQSDTRNKEARGGKGLGRLTWLRVFQEARISSVYGESTGLKKRTFRFALPDGVSDYEVHDASPGSPIGSVVFLSKFDAKYREASPKSTTALARRVLDHFFEFFVLDSCPSIVLRDGSEILNLNQVFTQETDRRVSRVSFQVQSREFEILNVLTPAGKDEQHRLHFCAHKRSVCTEPLDQRVPDLPHHLQLEDSRRGYLYGGYVSGSNLDESVNDLRTRFNGQDPNLFEPGDVP